MSVHLVEPNELLKTEYYEFISEWENANEKIIPYAARPRGMSFDDLLNDWEQSKTSTAYEKGFVPSTIYFLVSQSGRILGSVHIRHELNDNLRIIGGHIGYGIRPSERRKGYASKILKLGLEKAMELNIDKVLLTCDDDNIASARTIESSGGVLLEKEKVDEILIRRYEIICKV